MIERITKALPLLDIERLAKIYLISQRPVIEKQTLPVLEVSVKDTSYVGSALSNEAYELTNDWLNYAPHDKLFQDAQTLATKYAGLRAEKARKGQPNPNGK